MKKFLKGAAQDYTNIQMEWINHHTPIAYLKDANGRIVHELHLQDWNEAEIMNIFKQHNFVPKFGQYSSKPTKTVRIGDHYYELYERGLSNDLAKEFADRRNGYLVTIGSEDELFFIEAMLPKEITAVWIGAHRRGKKEFIWDNGPENGISFHPSKRAQKFNKWSRGEPNNHASIEDCVTFTSKGMNDVPCHWKMSFILEFNEKPSENGAPAPKKAVSKGPCKDSVPGCTRWAKVGECEKNIKWMRRYCQLSCYSCGDKHSEL